MKNVFILTYLTLKKTFYFCREQLLHVLLSITTLVLNKKPPRRKEDTLSGKLAPAIFQVINTLHSKVLNGLYYY